MTQVTIAGEQFEIKAPYAAGHPLNEAEASVLNQTFLENVRNNSAGKIKAAKEVAEKAGTVFSVDTFLVGEGAEQVTLRQSLQAYADAYEFGVRTARTSEPVDPVQREARAIAKEALAAAMKAKGIKRKDLTDEQYEAAVAQHAASDKVQKEANRRQKAKADLGLESLGLTADEPATETTEEPAAA